jgi:anti-sigma-K factor RskA
MSKDMNEGDIKDLRAALGGEIALGLVDGVEAARALAQDPLLAAEVARWNERLALLALEAPAAAPAPSVLAKLTASIARENDAVRTPAQQPSLLHRLAFWRGLSAAGFAAAAAACVFAFWQPPPMMPATQTLTVAAPPSVSAPQSISRVLLVSSILPKDGPAEYVATFDAERGRLVVVPAATLPSRAGIPFLWLVPNDDGEPVAIGVLDPQNTIHFDLSLATAKQADLKSGLVITLEPVAVPAGGAAQGAVLAHGKFSSH